VLTFGQARRGLASWLAEPAPMGALEFISSEAYMAGGFVMKEPSAVVDELFEYIAASDEGFEQRLTEFEREHSIDFRKDLAAALGGEFAIALDGPVLPIPSWKFVMEVYDPTGLQRTLEWLVAKLNEVAGDAGRGGFSIVVDAGRGRTYYELRSLDTGLSAHYTFVDGYWVAAASRGLLDRALQYRSSGYTLTSAPGFRALLPTDRHVSFSGVYYQNLGPILEPFARTFGEMANGLDGEQRRLIEQLGASTGPSLTLAYGDPNRITFVNRSEGGLLGSTLGSFLRLRSLMDVQELLGQTARQHAPREAADPAASS